MRDLKSRILCVRDFFQSSAFSHVVSRGQICKRVQLLIWTRISVADFLQLLKCSSSRCVCAFRLAAFLGRSHSSFQRISDDVDELTTGLR